MPSRVAKSATIASLAALIAAGSWPLTMIWSPPPPNASCSDTATVKSSVLNGASAVFICSREAVEVGVVREANGHHRAVGGATGEGGLERLGAGVRLARDRRLDELDLGEGGLVEEDRLGLARCGRARRRWRHPAGARP